MATPISDLIQTFQEFVAQVPELVQPLIVALAGAVPFIEGEGAAGIGILGGINPVVAAIAGAVGNFLCVAALVLLGSKARGAVVARARAKRTLTGTTTGGGEAASLTARPNTGGAGGAVAASAAGGSMAASVASGVALADRDALREEKSPRMAKFRRAFERFGVPGVSLLGPLLLPTHFTATALVAAGVSKGRVLVWQAAAIVLWTTLVSLLMTGVVRLV